MVGYSSVSCTVIKEYGINAGMAHSRDHDFRKKHSTSIEYICQRWLA